MKRVGLFSGTFDPIHDGHILFAQAAMGEFGLDEVIFAPEATPRYKEFATDITYRAAMIERATAEYDYLKLLLAKEGQHGLGILDEIAEAFEADEIYMLIGGDVLDHIADWEDIDEISHRVMFVVASRDGETELLKDKADIAQINYELLPTPANTISSSKIRQALADRMPPKGLDDTVAKFIEQHELYG